MINRSLGIIALALGVLPPAPSPLAAQLRWEPLSNEGVLRASALVDSVFVNRVAQTRTIGGGDWVSYLAARLGVVPIPDSMTIRVAVDSARILVDGQLRDLPRETRALFGPLAMLMDSTTTLRADVVMAPSGPGHVRFVLRSILVNGIAIPEFLLQPVLVEVGKQYPELTESGRQLYVAVPEDGKVQLVRNGVLLRIEAKKP